MAKKKATKKAPTPATKKSVKKVAKKSVSPKASSSMSKVAPKKMAKKASTKPVKPAKAVTKASASKANASKVKVGKVAANVPVNVPVVSSGLPAVRSVAPAFSLPSSTGKMISLSDYVGKTVVVYFYPRADTPGCTVQACGFRDGIAGYQKLGVEVLGVSPDSAKEVEKFAKKFNLGFPLLADADKTVCQAYGVWVQKSMYGKTYMGAARTTFIIRDGVIVQVFEKVKPEGHDAEVLAALQAM